MTGKIATMEEAVARYVWDGMSIALGCSLEGFIPFAFGHEVMRQERKDLTLIGPISDMLFDQMIGGGCVGKVIAAWVGNVSTGVGYHFRRAVEQGVPRPLEVENHSNFSLALALHAGAMGVPFAITRSLPGSDILRDEGRFRRVTCPFTGESLPAVAALKPDLTVLHAQRADRYGNVQLWGCSGVAGDAARAAQYVVVVVEELVETEVIRTDPNRTFLPGFLVNGLVVEPQGAHPSPVQGYYGRHDRCYVEYAGETREPEGGRDWLRRYVYDVSSRAEYLKRFPSDELESLRVKHSRPTGSVEFGF